MKNSTIKYAFFGSSRFSVIVLDEMQKLGYIPTLVITTPDKPQGRKLVITPNPVKIWAVEKNIKFLTPEKLDTEFIQSLKNESCELFIVASYGKILPDALINIPPRKTLNIHPSLLPKYRGASPLQSAILDDTKNTGVTIMRIDEKMDHGPIVAQKQVTINEWPTYEDFEIIMASEGAKLLATILSDWSAGKIEEIEQDHSLATYTQKTSKEDGLIDLEGDPYFNFRKSQAYHEWPQAYFFVEHSGSKIRVKITSASFGSGKLVIEKVIPEGGKEMGYADFLSGYGNKVAR
ncbi:MAG: hypothetical protein RL536_375 [Candidatus Parcubacteria bacterium]|jgi:methionyl-tRNA formyltransferase